MGASNCSIKLGYIWTKLDILCRFRSIKIFIGKAAAEFGVTRETRRCWEATGKITSDRTPKGHRRYDLSQLQNIASKKKFDEKRTIAYARVSSHELKF